MHNFAGGILVNMGKPKWAPAKYRDIGVAPSTVKDFIQSGNYSFPVLLDTNQDVALEYNIRGIPTTVFIDKDGIIQVIKVGAFPNMIEIKRSLSKIIP